MPVKLGDLLLKEKMISPQQLQEGLIVENLSGVSLRRALVNLGFVRDEDVTGLLSRRYGRSSVDLGNLEIDPAVIKVIATETARKYQVLPLSRVDKTLRLAMADPNNVLAMDDIGFITGLKVEPVVASEVALEEAIDRYYGPVDALSAIGGLSEIDLDSLASMHEADKNNFEEIELGKSPKLAGASPIVKLTSADSTAPPCRTPPVPVTEHLPAQ